MNDEEKKKSVMATIGMILIVIFAFWVIYYELPVPEKIIEIFTPEAEPTPEPTPTPTINDTPEEPWDVCDPRHNASWLYAHGCYGNRGGRSPDTPRGVDIIVAGVEPWSATLPMNISNVFPGNLVYTEIPVRNAGVETAELWLRITVTNESGGDARYANVASSEPEYTEGGGFETGGYVEQCNLSENIIYGITVSIGNSGNIIIDPHEGFLLNDMDGEWIYLRQVSVGETVHVGQSYFMIGETSNWAQGDVMTFDLEFYAVSLDGSDP